MRLRRVIFGSLMLLAALAHAKVAFAPLFTDGAVLQREKPVPVWGSADAGEVVTISYAGQTCTALTGPDGRWIALLQAMVAVPIGTDLTATGVKSTAVAHDVVVGEVWLCSGQSNMEFTVDRAMNAPAEIANAHFPLLRHIKIERQMSESPVERVTTSGWKAATPETVGSFTAVGYFFARDLYEKLGVPVGVIHSSWGGTPIESWLSPTALASNPAYQVVNERWRERVAAYPTLKPIYDEKLAAWTAAGNAVKASGEAAHAAWLKQNPKPAAPRGPGDQWTPTSLFNGMINPLLPYALRGVLWYQGESNADRASEYHALFTTLITSWRAHFGQGELPFYWVNLANYRVPSDRTDLTYAFLREAQTQTLALPNTGQALAIDIGNPNDIHPTNKQEVGRRLALLAKHRVYGFVNDDVGPTFAGAAREGAGMRVQFTEVSGGLVSREKPPQALELAGADRVFHPAVGRIDRNTLLVTSPQVKEPVAVRYAWRNAPEANLYNGAGLPAVPFRSDSW
jgi:sialate O-acetylesterase